MDSQVESGYGAGTQISATRSNFDTFLTTGLGASNVNIATNEIYFKFSNPWELITGATGAGSNYRFRLSNLFELAYFNSSPSGVVNSSGNILFQFGPFFSSSLCQYGVINQYGMWLINAPKGSAGTIGSPTAFYFGWVKNPVFPTNTSERLRNIVWGRGTNNSNTRFTCCRATGTTTVGVCATATTISCQSPTPGANVTDLVVVDTNTSNLAIGSLHNSLVYNGALTPGQIYRIPPSDDPDGNNEQNIWLCVYNSILGFDGSTSVTRAASILIRVWSNNIT